MVEADQEWTGPDGLERRLLDLGGFRFEVTWDRDKRAKVLRDRGIDFLDAVHILDDPGHALEPQQAPYNGQYRVVGVDPRGRLLTMAVSITYPDGAEDSDDVGTLRVYTCWRASSAERAFRFP